MATCTFFTEDDTTQGSWLGVFGGDGYNIPNDGYSYPSYVSSVTITGATYSWASTTTDVRGCIKPSNHAQRIASIWYSATYDNFDIVLDSSVHRVGIKNN